MNKHILKLLEEINKRNTTLRDIFKMNVEVYDLTKPLTNDDIDKLLVHCEVELSPEVLTCDGERRVPKGRVAMLTKAQEALRAARQ